MNVLLTRYIHAIVKMLLAVKIVITSELLKAKIYLSTFSNPPAVIPFATYLQIIQKNPTYTYVVASPKC